MTPPAHPDDRVASESFIVQGSATREVLEQATYRYSNSSSGLFVSASGLTGALVQKLKTPILTAQQRLKIEENVLIELMVKTIIVKSFFPFKKGLFCR